MLRQENPITAFFSPFPCYDAACSILASRKQSAIGSFMSRALLSRYSSFGGCCESMFFNHTRTVMRMGSQTKWLTLPIPLQNNSNSLQRNSNIAATEFQQLQPASTFYVTNTV